MENSRLLKELREIERDTHSGVKVELVDGSLSHMTGTIAGAGGGDALPAFRWRTCRAHATRDRPVARAVRRRHVPHRHHAARRVPVRAGECRGTQFLGCVSKLRARATLPAICERALAPAARLAAAPQPLRRPVSRPLTSRVFAFASCSPRCASPPRCGTPTCPAPTAPSAWTC